MFLFGPNCAGARRGCSPGWPRPGSGVERVQESTSPPLPRPSQCDVSNPGHGTSPRLKGNTSSDPANLPNLSPSSHEGEMGTRLHCDGRDSDDRRHHDDLSDATEMSTVVNMPKMDRRLLPCWKVHSGIKGFVRVGNKNGIADAVISVRGINHDVTTAIENLPAFPMLYLTVTTGSMSDFPFRQRLSFQTESTQDGDYWRLLVAGTYRVTASWGGWS
ncbi:hypothetical protein Bbelb_240310 [Branchiostoma belcheri]|nr:hypothetical protein Bbelb_240310 [Branchiostoma belcheri]